MSIADVVAAVKRQRVAEAALAAAVKETWPVGSLVQFEKWRGSITAEVLSHSHDGSLRVRNVDTDKQYWITTYDAIGPENWP